MKKFLIFITICVLVVSLTNADDGRAISGGTARNISLGGGPLNPFLLDASWLHINPALAGKYADFVWGDIGYVTPDCPLGSGTSQYIGANFRLGMGISGGIIINKREGLLYTIDPTDPVKDPIGHANIIYGLGMGRPLSPIEIFGSYAIDALNVGLSFTMAGWSSKDVNSTRTIKGSNRITGFKAGATYDLGEGNLVDAAVLFRLNSVSGDSTPVLGTARKLELDGGNEMGFNGRFIYTLNDNWSFLPIVRFYTYSFGPKFTPAPPSPIPNPPVDLSYMEMEFGIGANYKAEKVLIAGGLSFQSMKSETEDKSVAGVTSKTTCTITDLPKINFGVEYTVADWLIARAGYFRRLGSKETKTDVTVGGTTTSTTYTESQELAWYGDPNNLTANQQAFTLGVGLHFAGFSFDGTIGEGFLLKGPYILSGQTNNLIGMLSMHYYW